MFGLSRLWERLFARPAPSLLQREADPQGPRRGALVLVADGVGGFDLCGKALKGVLRRCGLPHVTRTIRWGLGTGRWYADLSDVANQDARAAEVADAARRYREEAPDGRVFLVGKSGGCVVMVKALERLSEGAPVVDRAVLLAPALSPGYDLSRALGNVGRDIVVFWSPLDVIFLGAGTRIFGTSDRVWCSGAGRVGFLRPAEGADSAERLAAYRKLRQVRWSPRMSSTGYLGGHLGPDSPRFLKKYVVPLLRIEPAVEC